MVLLGKQAGQEQVLVGLEPPARELVVQRVRRLAVAPFQPMEPEWAVPPSVVVGLPGEQAGLEQAGLEPLAWGLA